MKKIFTAILIISTAITLYGQDNTGYTLQDYLVMGLENNYDIKIIRNNQLINENNASLGNAGYLPAAELSTSYNGAHNNLRTTVADGDHTTLHNLNSNTINAGLNISWSVFDGLGVQYNYRKLKELANAGELAVRYQTERFISDFTSLYYSYVREIMRLKNLEYAVELSNERVRIVDARYNIGALSRLDLQQANVDMNTDKSQLIKQYETLHSIRTSLNEMLARADIENEFIPVDSLILYSDELNRDIIWGKAMTGNIYLKIASKQTELNILDLKIVESRSYPYVRLNAGYGYTGNWMNYGSYDKQNTAGLNYGLTVGFTLFDGFNQKRRIRNARIELENTELSYMQVEKSIEADLSKAWMSYVNNMNLVTLEKSNLETARDNYGIAIERYKLGQLSGIELREAQTSLLQAEERLVQAQYDTKLCEISLKMISGDVVDYLFANY